MLRFAVWLRIHGTSLILPEAGGLKLVSGLPKRGIVVWEFTRGVEDSRTGAVRLEKVRLPLSRRLVRVYRVGDGRLIVVPQGDLVTVWRVVLRAGKGASDLMTLVKSTPFAKRMRQLEVDGTYGPGGSLPLAVYAPEDPDYPKFGKRTPAGVYVRAMQRAFGVKPFVAEVGLALPVALRLADRLGLGVSDASVAAAVLASAARAGELLLILRRMPLTDPLTGFVIVLPVFIDVGAGDVHGEMIWLPPDIALALFGDEDGDRYYVDLAAAVNVDRWAHDESAVRAYVRPVAAFWTGAVSAPAFLSEPPVKMAGLHGAAALAGVLSVQGVGPLFSVVYRLAGSIERAGFKREAALVSSYLMRVFEPLFDARKRLVAGKVVGSDSVTGEPVIGYSLPYASAIIRSVRSETVGQVRDIMARLAADLLADDDEDARATGSLVQQAVSVMDEVLSRTGDIRFGLTGSPDFVMVELRDIDLFAATAGYAPLDGSLTKSVARPVLSDRRSQSAVPDGWSDMRDRELRHFVGGDSFVGIELPLPLSGADDDVPDVDEFGNIVVRQRRDGSRVLPGKAVRALSHLAIDLPVLVLLDLMQRAPRNQRDAQLYEAGNYAVLRTEGELRAFAGADAIVDRFNRFQPVFWHAVDGQVVERVRVYLQPPVKIEDGVALVDEQHPSRLAGDDVVHDKRAFKIGLGWVEHGGVTWYRWHLIMLVANKSEGVAWTGKPFTSHRYALVSVYTTPWFAAEPGAFVSGCEVRSGFDARAEWLPGRFDAVVTGAGEALRVDALYMTPQVSLLAALLAGLFWSQLGVMNVTPPAMVSAVRAALLGETDPGGFVYGADEAVRVQRAARQTVRRIESQALTLRHELSESTAKHVTVFGDLLRDGLRFAGVSPDEDVAMHRFDKLVGAVVKKLYGDAAIWYPRKGGQNRIIGIDLADAGHWSDLMAYGGQEWYRFVRETPGLMSVEASVHGKRGVVHEMLVALVDAPGFIQPQDGKSSSETAYLFRQAVDYVEQERSQLVHLVPDVSFDGLVRPLLLELKAHGFNYLRAVDGGVVEIDAVLAQSEIDFELVGVAHRIYEASITSDAVDRSLQFWAVSRSCPVGAKVVVLDGMIKSFATVVTDAVTLGDGTPVDAIFSAISARKKQAWGLFLNGAARMVGIDPAPIWAEYRRVLSELRAQRGFDVTVAGSIETEAMNAAFAKARELGVELKPVELYIERGGKREKLGEAFVGRIMVVFIDDTTMRDDDPDEAGFNGTVLFSAQQFGVPYQRRFIKMARALELSQAVWYQLAQEEGLPYAPDVSVVDVDAVLRGGDDDPEPGPDGDGTEIQLDVDESEVDTDELAVQLAFDFGDDDDDGGGGGMDLSVVDLSVDVGADSPVVDLAALGSALAGVDDGVPDVGDPGADDPGVDIPDGAVTVDLSQLDASLIVGASDAVGESVSVVSASDTASSVARIDSFKGTPLSNFHPVRVVWNGVEYPSVENAYQAAKFDHAQTAYGHVVQSALSALRTCSAAEAKRLARNTLHGGLVVFDESAWKRNRVAVMRELLRQKFSVPELRAYLLSTGDAELVEGNNWGDTFWGVCTGCGKWWCEHGGENMLGRLLMELRDELRAGVDAGGLSDAGSADVARASIIEVEGDLWVESERRGLPAVVPVNCVGVMGAGVAKQAADRYPGLLDEYRKHLAELRSGRSVYVAEYNVVLFPTKYDWRDASDLGLIASAARTMPVPAVLPRVGAGLGRLDWSDVKRVLLENLPMGEWVVVVPADTGADTGTDTVDVPVGMCLVVGTRQPTAEQVQACREAVRSAVDRGLTVLSGGAEGIDTIAVTAAVEFGGSAISILPWARQHSLPGSVEVQPAVDAEARRIVLETHPNPSALSEGAIKLHARNLRMVQRLMSVREARRAAGQDVKHCIILALPSFYRGEPSGGTTMAMRLAKLYNLPCRYYVPGQGWVWWHKP